MNFSAYAIKNPLAAILLFILLTFLGVFGFFAMKVQQFPDMDFPGVMTTIILPGASPDQLENEIAKKVENKLANIDGIKNIRTTLNTGVVTIFSEFVLEKPTDEAVDDVRSAVSEIQSSLPAAAEAPIIKKLSTAGFPVATYSVSSKTLNDAQLSFFIDDTLTKKLSTIQGVGSVSRIGGIERQIAITPKSDRLAQLFLPIGQLSSQIFAQWQDGTGGQATIGSQDQTIRIAGAGHSLEDLRALYIQTPTGDTIPITQIANIQDTHKRPTSIAQLDEQTVVAFSITRAKGAGEVAVVAAIDEALHTWQKDHGDITITKIVDRAEPIKQSYHATLRMLIEGGILAVVVVWVFLKNWRATLLAAIALPLSVIPTFFAMHILGFSLNMVSLLALTLVVGVLVDDAIVEIENIMRHLSMGKTPMQAALEAADEIGLAVIATTFTLIAVFLPTAFMDGIIGQFFRQFGLTAAIAVFMSLLVARLITPMMAAYFLTPITHAPKPPSKLMRWYLSLVHKAIQNRLWVLLFAAGFFVLSVSLVRFLPSSFLPTDESNQTQVAIELTPDARLQDTLRIGQLAQTQIEQIHGVESVLLVVGQAQNAGDPSSFQNSSSNIARLDIKLTNKNQRPPKPAIETQIQNALHTIPAARFEVGLKGAGNENGYSFSVSANDQKTLDEAVLSITQTIRRLPMVSNVISNQPLAVPELLVRPDFVAMSDKGVTTTDIANTLRIATMGDYDQALPKLTLESRQLPIVVQLSDSDKSNLDTLKNLYLPSTKNPVQLHEVADISMTAGASAVLRLNQARTVKITVFSEQMALGDLMHAVKNSLSTQQLPANIHLSDEGQAENMTELFAGFALAMGVGVFCIFAVLMLLFGRILQPLTILMALPLAVGGAFLGLLWSHSALSTPAMIGFILLMGIATKNSILLVDYAILAQKQGKNQIDALLDACQKRAQPIIMTTIAMGAGMLPLLLGLGDVDTSFSRPMAASVLGGLITSTFLSLVVVPVMYTVMDDWGAWRKRANTD